MIRIAFLNGKLVRGQLTSLRAGQVLEGGSDKCLASWWTAGSDFGSCAMIKYLRNFFWKCGHIALV